MDIFNTVEGSKKTDALKRNISKSRSTVKPYLDGINDITIKEECNASNRFDTDKNAKSLSEKNIKSEKRLCCLICRTEGDKFHANSICDPCYQSHYQTKLDQFMTEMSSCMICVNTMYNGIELTKHNCTRAGVFVCEYCNVIFCRKSHLEQHMKRRLKNFKCLKCCLSFCSNSAIKFHENTHNDIQCVINEQGNKNKITMECESAKQCGLHDLYKKQLSSEQRLLQESSVHYPNTNSHKYNCQLCKKSSNQCTHFKSHLLTHETQSHYMCQHCKKTFNQFKTFKNHLLSHENKRQYKCQRCEKAKFHLLVHENRRDYQCQHCKKTFNHSYSLKKHLISHENKRDYKCQHCKKSFKRSNDLNKHWVIHENKRNYKCQRCEKSFNRSDQLKAHLRTHKN